MITVNGTHISIDPGGRVDPDCIIALFGRTVDLDEYLGGRREELLDNSDRMDRVEAVKMATHFDADFGRKIEHLLEGLTYLRRVCGWHLEAEIKAPNLRMYKGDVKAHFRNPDNMIKAVFDDMYFHKLSLEFFGVGEYGVIKNKMTKTQQEHYDKLVQCHRYHRMRDAGRTTFIKDEVNRFMVELIGYNSTEYDVEGTDWA